MMKALTDCYTLANGVKIPCIGFGTWQTPNGEVAVSSVLSALEAGYRHIDTAQGYGNEESVGIAVKQSGIDRKELFLTSASMATRKPLPPLRRPWRNWGRITWTCS